MNAKTILAMSAHPDDMEIEAGGTLRKWADEGHDIYSLVLTNGEYRSNKEKKSTKEDILKEVNCSSKILMIKETIFLDYFDTQLQCNGKIISEVDSIINQIHPDFLISHHPFDSHQDHKAASEIMFAVSRKGRIKNVLTGSPLPYRPNIFAYKPQYFVDISSTINQKLEALRCFKSQYEKYGEELWIDRIKSVARVMGWAMEFEYAESFEVIRMTGEI